MIAYGIFEGGGAKGYAHVGALKAAEERGIEFRAVAGTSIGAVSAAFVAGGFQADELYIKREDGTEDGILADDLELRLLDQRELRRINRLRNPVSCVYA